MQRSDDALKASSNFISYNGIKTTFNSSFNHYKYSQRVKVIPEGTAAAQHYSTVSVRYHRFLTHPNSQTHIQQLSVHP
jgi:hypothetical protein